MWKTLRRNVRWWLQRRRLGWDDRDLWSLDMTTARFLAPRLEYLRDRFCGYPLCADDEETWFAMLDKMAQAFRIIEADVYEMERDAAEVQAYVDEGLDLFASYFQNLWD